LSYDELLTTVGCAPYKCASSSIVLALSPQPTLTELQERPVALLGDRARECWLADMQIAAIVYEAIHEKRLYLVYQPIAGILGNEALLYSECLSRILGQNGDGDLVSPGVFIPALERLGLTRLFDAYVVREVIRLLEDDQEAYLGCNVSALSAVGDLWWQDIQQKLATDPAVAVRFVVEVTETASFSGLDEAKSFIENMRLFGCMVALDDFGVGNNSLRVATVVKPDIIKIDASLTGAVAERDFGKEFLPSLVRLSSCLARHVIVEGVACAEDFERSIAAGAEWFQGYYIQPPSSFRQFRGPACPSSSVPQTRYQKGSRLG
jgi:EAL domain-containing protein (putative c-di-GMP-specific phosphodiesterase class I)